MKTGIVHTELIERKEKLHAVSLALKAKFIGLDDVIDEIVGLMMPWYIFPEAQLRPTVINLWGLTGSGKTALIQELVELLDYKNLYAHLDMGEFETGSSAWLKDIFTDDLEYFDKKAAIICMDEFQFAKTIDEKRELGRDKLRVIWEILDSGKMNYVANRGTFYLYRADACLTRIERVVANGMELCKGVVAGDESIFKMLFTNFFFEEYNRFNEEIGIGYFISRDFIEGLFNLYEEPEFTREQLREKVVASSFADIQGIIIKGMKARTATKQLDLSRGLIFVLGNLDEAYAMSSNMNPDISADEFHEATGRITIATIKNALRKRFRSEQVARLGNNHIIYRSFRNVHFKELIRRELLRVAEFAKATFGWEVRFDSTVGDVVYAEGVFPSQGTRPVFTTVKNLIESRISKIALEVIGKGIIAKAIAWKYEDEHFVFGVSDADENVLHTFRDAVRLKTENLRKPLSKQIQAHTAVHEAGHAILAALTFRILPAVGVSKTAAGDCEGFCLINFPDGPMTRDTIRKDIVISLGRYVAEKMIFGDENTCSGVSHDIENATELANKAIRKFAMGVDPILISVESVDADNHFFHQDRYSQEAVNIIKKCIGEAEEILERNKLLLLKMSEYLTTHSRMEEKMIGEFVQQYSVDDWVLLQGFIKKEEYYDFYTIVERQIKELEKRSECAAGTLVYAE